MNRIDATERKGDLVYVSSVYVSRAPAVRFQRMLPTKDEVGAVVERLNEEPTNERLREQANDLMLAFKEAAMQIDEVFLSNIRPFLKVRLKPLIQDLFKIFITYFKPGELPPQPHLIFPVLKEMIREIPPELLDRDDLEAVMHIMFERIRKIKDKAKHGYKEYELLHAFSGILDAMVDTGVVVPTDRNFFVIDKTDFTMPVLEALRRIEEVASKSYVLLAAEAAYAIQALGRLPKNESDFYSTVKRVVQRVEGIGLLVEAITKKSLKECVEAYDFIKRAFRSPPTIKAWHAHARAMQIVLMSRKLKKNDDKKMVKIFEQFKECFRVADKHRFLQVTVLNLLCDAIDVKPDDKLSCLAIDFISKTAMGLLESQEKNVVIVRRAYVERLIEYAHWQESLVCETARRVLTEMRVSKKAPEIDVLIPERWPPRVEVSRMEILCREMPVARDLLYACFYLDPRQIDDAFLDCLLGPYKDQILGQVQEHGLGKWEDDLFHIDKRRIVDCDETFEKAAAFLCDRAEKFELEDWRSWNRFHTFFSNLQYFMKNPRWGSPYVIGGMLCQKLAMWLMHVRVRPQEALEVSRESLERLQREFGKGSVQAADGFYDFGYLAYCNGDYKIAEQNYQKALDIYGERLRENHPKAIRTAGRIGNCISRQYLKEIEKTASLRNQITPPKDEISLSRKNADKLRDKALEKHSDACSRAQNKGLLEAEALCSKAISRIDLGDYATSLECFEVAWGIYKVKGKDGSLDWMIAAQYMSFCLKHLGDQSCAPDCLLQRRNYYQEAAQRSQQLIVQFGEDHPLLSADFFNNLGICLEKSGEEDFERFKKRASKMPSIGGLVCDSRAHASLKIYHSIYAGPSSELDGD